MFQCVDADRGTDRKLVIDFVGNAWRDIKDEQCLIAHVIAGDTGILSPIAGNREGGANADSSGQVRDDRRVEGEGWRQREVGPGVCAEHGMIAVAIIELKPARIEQTTIEAEARPDEVCRAGRVHIIGAEIARSGDTSATQRHAIFIHAKCLDIIRARSLGRRKRRNRLADQPRFFHNTPRL